MITRLFVLVGVGFVMAGILVVEALVWYVILASRMLIRERGGVKAPRR